MADNNAASCHAGPVVRCLITTVLLLFIALSIASLTAWLILHPTCPDFRVKSLSLSNSSTGFEIDLTVGNPNWKINLVFHYMDVSISYEKREISRTRVPSFELPKKGRAEKKIELDGDVDSSSKRVGYDLKMSGAAMLRAGKWFSKERYFQVQCKNLTVVLSGKFDNVAGAGCSSSFT